MSQAQYEFRVVFPEGFTAQGDKLPCIVPGSYSTNQVCDMLRRLKGKPDAVQFIADMLEV